MICGEQQQREIKTIKERNIHLKLSDADCERIAEKAGKVGLTVAELLEAFIGDLVCGTYSNGSDERDYAKCWFNRCWFGMFPEETLLSFLLNSLEYNVEDFLALPKKIEEKKGELEYYIKEYPEDAENPRMELDSLNQEFKEIKDTFLKENEKADWQKEIEKVKKWMKEVQELKGE
jgi:SpoVK/Ycf46/Vps4 family AAA+-type ATPase